MEFRILFFERKELRFFEPVEEMCRQVVARKKGMSHAALSARSKTML